MRKITDRIIDSLLRRLLKKKMLYGRLDYTPMVVYSLDHINAEIFIDGIYERRNLELMLPFLKQGMQGLDIGANIGNHSLFFASRGCIVHSFEANPLTFKILDINCSDNDLISTYNFALASKNSSLVMSVNDSNKGNTSLSERMYGDEPEVTIDALKYDDLGMASELKLDFIKIDVEGMELDVLKGMSETLIKHKPIIFFEYNRDSSLLEFLNSINYKIINPRLPYKAIKKNQVHTLLIAT